MLFYTGTTLAAAMYIVGAVEIVLVCLVKFQSFIHACGNMKFLLRHRPTWLRGFPFLATLRRTRK